MTSARAGRWPGRRPGRRPGLRARTVAAALAAAALLAGCSTSGTGGADGSGKGYVSGDGAITVLSPDQRPEPVALAGTTLEGARLDLVSLRGKVVVLNVWGSWCPPCRKEAPDLQKAYTQLKPQGVEFVGIDVNEQSGKDAPLAFQKKFGITYPSLADDGGKSLLALRGSVSAKTIPSTLVLDTQGRIAVRINDATDASTLTALVGDVLAGRDPKVS